MTERQALVLGFDFQQGIAQHHTRLEIVKRVVLQIGLTVSLRVIALNLEAHTLTYGVRHLFIYSVISRRVR